MEQRHSAPAKKLWIMVDVETSGPVYDRHSLLEIGAVVGSREGGIEARFEVLLAPLSDEVKTSQRTFRRAKELGIAPRDGIRCFAEWAAPWRARGADFIARPAAFDWPWIVHYAWRYLGENPFGFKAVCASAWLEAKGRRFDVDLPHVAVDDAEIQLRHFLAHAA